MLWLSPEHLVATNSTERVSLKGDVYSFGIILYEVALRALPYSTFHSLSPEGKEEIGKNLKEILQLHVTANNGSLPA